MPDEAIDSDRGGKVARGSGQPATAAAIMGSFRSGGRGGARAQREMAEVGARGRASAASRGTVRRGTGPRAARVAGSATRLAGAEWRGQG